MNQAHYKKIKEISEKEFLKRPKCSYWYDGHFASKPLKFLFPNMAAFDKLFSESKKWNLLRFEAEKDEVKKVTKIGKYLLKLELNRNKSTIYSYLTISEV